MAIPSRQIGLGTESNLLWQILKQLTRLTSVLFALKQATIPKYKVFTALLTQNGSGGGAALSGGDLNLGVTYYIDSNSDGLDMTNVGAPNNDIGTYFIATGTTPNSWGSGQILYDFGTPVVTILENTIGNIWFSYSTNGQYRCSSSNLFTLNKTTIDIDSHGQDGNPDALIFTNTDITETDIVISSYKGGYQDTLLFKNRLEIRVYN